MTTPIVLPIRPCRVCGRLVYHRGDQANVHFADMAIARPCAGSWPVVAPVKPTQAAKA